VLRPAFRLARLQIADYVPVPSVAAHVADRHCVSRTDAYRPIRVQQRRQQEFLAI
jgi:hypothetical protein